MALEDLPKRVPSTILCRSLPPHTPRLECRGSNQSGAKLTLFIPAPHPAGSQPPSASRASTGDVTDEESCITDCTEAISSAAGNTNKGIRGAFIAESCCVSLSSNNALPCQLCARYWGQR